MRGKTVPIWLQVFIFTLLLFSFSCREAPPETPYTPTISLAIEDVSCTEAFLKASLSNANEPRTIAILRDGQRVTVSRLPSADSVFVIEGLLPRHTYSFVAQRLSDSILIDATAPVQATTMDTTSHNFTFHLDTLGLTSSMLFDVAIINDTLAYAVGEISVLDSNGQLQNPPYNVAKWNGRTWEFMTLMFNCRLYFPNCGPETLIFATPRSVFAFDPNDVWISAGSLHHFDGGRWTQQAGIQGVGGAYKMWGSSSNRMWFVGEAGFIAYKDGDTWGYLQSGTNVILNDVWGGSNRWVGQNVVLVAASNKYTAGEKKLIRINSDGAIDSISWNMHDRRIHSTWFDQHSRIYTSGGGVFRNRGSGTWSEQPISLIYTNRVRGTAENDLWVVGDFGFAAHFNGYTWKEFPEVRLGGNYESLAVKGNVMIAVGWVGNKAVILRGTRQ